MKKDNFLEVLIWRIKKTTQSLGWKMFIWGLGTTQEEYWNDIYHQEVAHRKKQALKQK